MLPAQCCLSLLRCLPTLPSIAPHPAHTFLLHKHKSAPLRTSRPRFHVLFAAPTAVLRSLHCCLRVLFFQIFDMAGLPAMVGKAPTPSPPPSLLVVRGSACWRGGGGLRAPSAQWKVSACVPVYVGGQVRQLLQLPRLPQSPDLPQGCGEGG